MEKLFRLLATVTETNTADHRSRSNAIVYYAAGAIGGCDINASNTNRTYDGELQVITKETQKELEQAIKAGKFMFHNVDDEVRVLTDIIRLYRSKKTKMRTSRVTRPFGFWIRMPLKQLVVQ